MSRGQAIEILKKNIEKIVAHKAATVGVSIMGMHPGDTLSVNGNKKMPMQSVYKYHLAITVLRHVDLGNLNLKDSVAITKRRLNTPLWSVIQRKYPNGGTLTLGEIIRYTVEHSDNVGCDVLFELIGGPEVANDYIHSMGITDVSIKHNEKTMQSDWELQYQNWTTPNAATKALRTFFENEHQQLSASSHAFLWETMKASRLGKIAMKTYLPENSDIAYKTGYSGKNDEGLIGAQNAIGILFLSRGGYYYLSILIADSKETREVHQKIIANIAKLSYDYFEKRVSLPYPNGYK